MIRGLNIFTGSRREYEESAAPASGGWSEMDEAREIYKKKDYKSSFRNNQLKEEEMLDQVASELQFGQRMDKIASGDVNMPLVSGSAGKGIMPIHIEVPTSGQVYRFAKSIIKPEDELSFSVVYAQNWTENLINWLIIVLFVSLIYWYRNKLKTPWNWLKTNLKNSADLYNKHEYTINKYATSVFTPFILFALFIIFWSVSYWITAIILILLVASVIFHISNFIKKKKQERELWNKAIAEEELKFDEQKIDAKKTDKKKTDKKKINEDDFGESKSDK